MPPYSGVIFLVISLRNFCFTFSPCHTISLQKALLFCKKKKKIIKIHWWRVESRRCFASFRQQRVNESRVRRMGPIQQIAREVSNFTTPQRNVENPHSLTPA